MIWRLPPANRQENNCMCAYLPSLNKKNVITKMEKMCARSM